MDPNNNKAEDIIPVGDPEEGPIIHNWDFVIQGVHAIKPDRNTDTISTIAFSTTNSDSAYHHEQFIPPGHIIPVNRHQQPAGSDETSERNSIIADYRNIYRCR